MAFRLRALASVAWMLLFATGCPRNVYDLRMEPSPKGLVRTLSVWREGEQRPASAEDVKPDKQLEAEQLQRIGALYPERVSGEAEIHQTFRGTFAGKLPADVGGSGSYEAYDSPLGSGHWYIERFRGSDDFDAQIYDRRAAADRVTDLTLGWFDEQLKNSTQREAVHRWLHQDFRQDLRNVALFLSVAPQWQDRSDDADNLGSFRIPDEHPLLRVLQYAVEKGYIEASETTVFSRGSDEDRVHRSIRRKLGKVCKLSPADAEKEFAFIAPTKELEESWKTYLRTTPEYARLVTAAKKAKKPADEAGG